MYDVYSFTYKIHIMRTNIDIDDALMAQAMTAGPYKTKREAVEAGLKLLARQAAYREVLKWRGKLKWEGGDDVDWTKSPDSAGANTAHTVRAAHTAQEPTTTFKRRAGR